MSEIIMKALELAVMVFVFVGVGMVLPMIKQHIKKDKLDDFRLWVETAVSYAQQCFDENAKKKNVVVAILRDIRDKESIPLTDEQIDILIEAAVNQLKLIENDVIFVGKDDFPWDEEEVYDGTEG